MPTSNLPAVRPVAYVPATVNQNKPQNDPQENRGTNTGYQQASRVPPEPPSPGQAGSATQAANERSKTTDTNIPQDKGVTSDDIGFLTDKFSKNLESIGHILRTSVEAQNKAFKSDLDNVQKTYNKFVEVSIDQKEVLSDATESQRDVFKGLTDQFVKFRSDESADADKFHKDLLASLQALHAAGGNEEVTASIEQMIRSAMASTKVDPDRERILKKWEPSAKEKESWAYKLFGDKGKSSEISPEETAIASGKSEFLQKGLFKAEKTVTEKTPIEKMLESFLKEAAKKKGDGEKVGKLDHIEKLTISNLVVEKIGGRLGDVLDRIGMRERPKQIEEPKGPSYEELRKKSTEVEDVEFAEHIKPKEEKPEPIAPKLEYVEPKKAEPIEVKQHEPKEAKIEPQRPEIKTEGKRIQRLTTEKTPIAKAVSAAIREIKPPVAKPAATMVTLPTQRLPESPKEITPIESPDTPLAKETPVIEPKEAEDKDAGGGIGDTIANLLPSVSGLLPEAGGLASMALPALAVGAAGAAGYGIGTLASKGYEAARGGKASFGTDLFDVFGKKEKSANEISAEAFAAAKAKNVSMLAPKSVAPGTDLKQLSDDAQQAKEDVAAQKPAPIIVNSPVPSAPTVVPTGGDTKYMAVSATARSRETYFDRAIDKSFTAV